MCESAVFQRPLGPGLRLADRGVRDRGLEGDARTLGLTPRCGRRGGEKGHRTKRGVTWGGGVQVDLMEGFEIPTLSTLLGGGFGTRRLTLGTSKTHSSGKVGLGTDTHTRCRDAADVDSERRPVTEIVSVASDLISMLVLSQCRC